MLVDGVAFILGSGGFILRGSGWCWVYFVWGWVVLDLLWLLVLDVGFILDAGG